MKQEFTPNELHARSDQQWAERVEKILREWLCDQPYSTKLAFVLLDGCRLSDDFTQAVFREISEKYKAEVIHAAEELPGTLVNIEIFLTGIAADMLHSEDRMFTLSGKGDTAEPTGGLDEDDQELNSSEEDKSPKSGYAKPTGGLDEDIPESTPPDVSEKGKFGFDTT